MNVFDAAKYILDKKGPMTTMKLQKLLYYAQAWSLVWDENELFPEEFEAWAGGPVCREVFAWHRDLYRASAGDVDLSLLSDGEFSQAQKDTMDAVIRDYGNDSGAQLSELTHSEQPWIDARDGLRQACLAAILFQRRKSLGFWVALGPSKGWGAKC